MIVKTNEIEKFKKYLGAKTLKLHDLSKTGLNVPEFLAVPSSYLLEIVNQKGGIEKDGLEKLKTEIVQNLQCDKYAVRSSALIEDSETESHAGQFETRLAVRENELVKAIQQVIKQAFEYLKGDISKFSLLVQQFIEPTFSGVAFTRNPLGGREMVVEYVSGRGDKLVSGKVKSESIKFFWDSESDLKIPSKLGKHNFIKDFKKIEKLYNFPQDIEWCMDKKDFYIVQTRPITSLSKTDYDQIIYLDSFFSGTKDYYYEKTEISEIAPRFIKLIIQK